MGTTTTTTRRRKAFVTFATMKRRALIDRRQHEQRRRGGKLHKPLADLLDVLVHQFGSTQRSFAVQVKCSYSQITHWLNPGRTEGGPGIAACIRIAHAGHCSLVRVLYAAGHGEYATMIEEIYPEPEKTRRQFGERIVTPAEVLHLRDWRKLTEQEQQIHATLIKAAHIARAAMTPADHPAQKARA